MGETHLIVPVAQAEPAIGALRARHDPSAAIGVPAHLTVLGSFLDDPLDAADLADLRAIAAAHLPVSFSLSAVARFDHALYLVPEPPEPFVALTQAIWSRWPAHPPYGDPSREIVPHVTVAVGGFDEAALRRALEPHLPIACHATELWLLSQRADRTWRPAERFAHG
jgi:2'-5' RNA ligase